MGAYILSLLELSDKWDIILKQEALDGKKVMSALEDSPFENYEKIKKDLSALSKEEQMDVVYRYASVPRLLSKHIKLHMFTVNTSFSFNILS